MGIPTFDVDMNIISRLGDYPGSDDGLTPEAFRARFDLAGKMIQEYLNTILIPNLDMTTDVEALKKGVEQQLMAAFDAELGNYFDKVVQSGDYVLANGSKFNAVKMDDTLFSVYGGEAVMQGQLMSLELDEPVSIAVGAGTYGTYRNDLICLRFIRDDEGTESLSIVSITGTTTQNAAVDPAYYSNDINNLTAAVRDLPLYRVRITNTTATLEALFEPYKDISDILAEKVIAKLAVWEGGSY